MSSEISLSDSENEQDWDNLEELEIICPFCDQLLLGVHSAFEHSLLDHDFDFIKVKEKLKLDEYGWIRLVNFTRKSLKQNPSFNMNDLLSDQSWLEGELWLTPALSNDPLLYALDELHLESESPKDLKLSGMEQELKNARERAMIAERKLEGVSEAFQLYQTMVRNTFLKEEKESFKEDVKSDLELKDGYFSSYGELDIHETMLKDKVRTCAYRDAIYDNKEYFKDKIVLDIGCGTGILSLFAAKAGAAKVFAVDNSTIIKSAAEIAKLNNLDNVITYIPGKIEEITLPCEKVDVIISEWMGYFLLFEGMLNSVLFARDKWLSSNGLMAPSHVSMWISGFSDSDYINDRLHYWTDVYGFNMSPMKSFVVQDAQVDFFNSSSTISKPIMIKSIDTATVHADELNFSTEFQIIPLSDGFLHGILGWFDTQFNCIARDWKPISFSTSPFDTDTHWKQTLFVFSEPLPVKQGECKIGNISVHQLDRDLQVEIKMDDFIFSAKIMTISQNNDGIKSFYTNKIEELSTTVVKQTQNLRRLEAQRNQLNAKVRLLREELGLLQEPGAYVGEVVKLMGKNKVLVKVNPEGKYIVDIAPSIDIGSLTPSLRVALKHDSYQLYKILPNKIDPLVSLMMVEKVPDSTYEMVGGLDNQIKEIKEVIELPIKHPELFDSLGIAQPKGVLLYGPPGTGKTLLARAVAHHTDCKFIRVSGSELVQKYIGEGSRMVRELFVMAREHAPSIIFMDEIDSIGSSREGSGGGSGGGDSEVQRTMLELLNQLDGFEPTQNIKVIMATNRIDILDAALLRPGRIDRKIEFPPPNEAARHDILKIHSRRMNLTRGIDLRKIAETMPGASGAEVKGVCTEAGMYALRERRIHVNQEDFEMAVSKVLKKDSEQNMSIKKLFK